MSFPPGPDVILDSLGLGKWSSIPVTYAGGANCVTDLDLVETLSGSKVDLTFGRQVEASSSKIH